MAKEDIPLVAQRTGEARTSAGSGSGRLQDTRNLFQSNAGSGLDPRLIGALAGAMVGTKTGATPLTSAANAVTGVLGKVANAITGNSGSASNPGGQNTYGGTSSQSYVSPTNAPWTGTTPNGGTYVGGGGTGTVGSVIYPAGTSDAKIIADGNVPAGVDMATGNIIAQPDYTKGGANLTGVGGNMANPSATATPPSDQTAGTYFQDSYGNIYDGSGNLYAVNQSGTYYVNDPSIGGWINADTGTTVSANDLFGPSVDYTGGGYDPTMSDPNAFYDTNSYFATPDLGNAGATYDPYTSASSTPVDYTSYDYWTTPYKDGGMATPMMAKGGSVPHMATGGVLDSISTLLSGSGVQGALLGTLLGQIMGGSGTSNAYKGVDMSAVGNIAPRTTNFGMGMANYVPYTDYMPQMNSPLRSSAQNTQLNANLGTTGYTPNITPLGRKPFGMADGGKIPTHYTFGTQVNAEDFLAGGGTPENDNMHGGNLGGNIIDNGSMLSNEGNTPTMQGRNDYRNGSYVEGEGDGQSDSIPAMLADGEYVIDADVVAALGNGSNKAGAKQLDKMRHAIRKQKRSTPIDKIPPKAKSPLAYLKGAK